MTAETIEDFWENATAGDVVRVMNGEEVQARFSDEATAFFHSTITGWRICRPKFGQWVDKDGATWSFCQVYREPSWYANKPDPGPGFRLLGKFPDEPLAVGDEFFKAGWHPSCREIGDSQTLGLWYRRRIEPVEPDLGKVEAVPQFMAGNAFWHPSGLLFTITAKGFEVTQ
jgi:hypothetical protein